ncbi:MAG: endolytic transglycosylase MltG [bacterium]|nr:endolytic transglycosylase MltG [bacterium]
MNRRILAVLLIAGLTFLGLVIWWGLLRPGSFQAVDVEVRPGMPAIAILGQLEEMDLLPSASIGRAYLVVRGRDRALHYGWYRIPARSRPVDVLEQILDGRVTTLKVTIVEGTSAAEVGDLFTAHGLVSAGNWEALIQNTEAIQDLAPNAVSLEGYLYPDTYRFAVGLAQETAVQVMIDRFREVWSAEHRVGDQPWGTLEEIVTLASLVEAETAAPQERARIAGVFVNRLRRGMLLQCDPTVVYGLKRRNEWTGRLLRVHWLIDDPYNTYRYPGLPPGPINNPGRAALAAALHPEKNEYLYFVASPGGGHTFSRTLREHNRAVAEWQRSRR